RKAVARGDIPRGECPSAAGAGPPITRCHSYVRSARGSGNEPTLLDGPLEGGQSAPCPRCKSRLRGGPARARTTTRDCGVPVLKAREEKWGHSSERPPLGRP